MGDPEDEAVALPVTYDAGTKGAAVGDGFRAEGGEVFRILDNWKNPGLAPGERVGRGGGGGLDGMREERRLSSLEIKQSIRVDRQQMFVQDTGYEMSRMR